MSEAPPAPAKRSPLERATAIERVDEGVFRGEVPDGWQQGKGAFGGVVVAVLTRALVASEPERARTLRSLSADLCAPALPGAFEVRVSALRRGGSVSFLDARLLQGDAVVARASAALATSRAVAPVDFRPSAPTDPPWTDVPVLRVEPPLGPVFARHYEYRATGPLPFSGGAEPVAEGWVRERSPPEAHDEASIVALLDAWWPTTLTVASAPRAVATVGYTMQLLADPGALAAAEPLFYRAHGVASSGSFFVEMRELWSGGRVVAMNQQTFALLD